MPRDLAGREKEIWEQMDSKPAAELELRWVKRQEEMVLGNWGADTLMMRVAFCKIRWNRAEDSATWRYDPSADPPAKTDGGVA